MNAFLEFLKLKGRYYLVIALLSAFMLYMPRAALDATGVLELATDYKKYIGPVFLASLSLFIISIWDIHLGWILRILRRRKMEGKIKLTLHSLTEDEKEILRLYIFRETKTNTLRIDDGVVQSLVTKGVLYLASHVTFDRLKGASYNITYFAWEYLLLNPDILAGGTDVLYAERGEYF